MGVIKLNESLQPLRQPDYNFEQHIYDYVFDDSPEPTDNEAEQPAAQQAPVSPRRRQRQHRHRNTPRPQDMTGSQIAWDMNAALRHGQKGARKQRRLEDARLLSAMADSDDICEDLSDTLPGITTAFSALFTDENAMKAWTEFTELDEGEQAVFLERGIVLSETSAPSTSRTLDAGRQRSAKQSTKYGAKHSDKAFSAERSYQQIDRCYRQLLTSGNVPWGKIDHFESELSAFFLEDSEGVYICEVPSSYDRLLLHATAQYLTLQSKSLNLPGGGGRQTEVENRRPYFIPPRTGLSDHVAQMKQPSRRRTRRTRQL